MIIDIPVENDMVKLVSLTAPITNSLNNGATKLSMVSMLQRLEMV